MLGQSGTVHIVTYGYVDSVDIAFPAELQAAALADKENPNLSTKILGTERMVKDADIVGRLLLLNDGMVNKCTRIKDYAFTVPLSLNNQKTKEYMINPVLETDPATGQFVYKNLQASGNFKLKHMNEDGTVRYDSAFYLTDNNPALVTIIETAYKNNRTITGNINFRCGISESGDSSNKSITDKLRTHLVN